MANSKKSDPQLTLIQTISGILSNSATPGEGLGKSADLLAGHANAGAVQVSALAADGERIVEIHSSGKLKKLFPSGLRRPSHGSSMRAISDRGPFLFTRTDMLEASNHGVEDFSVFIAAGYNHLAAAPVRIHSETLGSVQLLSEQPLSKDSLEILGQTVQLFAPYVALFLDRIESAAEDRISLSIERVAEAVIQENVIEGVCDAVVKFARSSMGIDAAILRVKDPANGELKIEYKYGHLDPAEVAGKYFPIVERQLIPLATANEGPMIIDEGSPEIFNDREVLPLLEEIPSLLITPLLDRDYLLGTMEFYSLNEYAYRAEHLRNVEHVANLLTSAVEHFRLIRSLSREAEIRSFLAEVARLASAAHNLNSLVESISPKLQNIIPIDRVTYYMPPERFHPVSGLIDDETADELAEIDEAKADPIVLSGGLAQVVVAGQNGPACRSGSKNSKAPSCGAENCVAAKLWDDAEDRPQGWIHLERADSPFTSEELELIPEFARHISPAIDTALSHESELRLAQEQLRAERAEAEVENQQKLNEAKQNFIATMSHELRTPLTSIRAFADLLNRDHDKLSERQRKQIAVVRRNSEWLNILINDLLDLSSIDSGRFELQYEDVELGSLLEGLAESFGPIAEVAGHDLKVIHPRRPVKMEIDPNRVSQVIGNMVTNAMKYSSSGTPIRLLARPVNNGVSIYIRDEGPGIPQKQQKVVFDRFVRAKSEASGRARGTGIGLYVSKMIVEGHGGEIGVTSQLNSHTTMHFWLPCEKSSRANGSRRSNASDAA